ncbi:MAG: nuclease [Actinobacteria bacterium]|nr:nuclease [Actinomycetota bacterium]
MCCHNNLTSEANMATTTRTAHSAQRVPSKLEQHNARRRRSAGVLAIIGVLGAVLFVGSLSLFVLVLDTVARHSATPYAAEPTVIDVVDGDTIDVRIGYKRQRIRILGLDTPETKDPRKPVQCFGREASNHTAQLLPPGTIVRLERDIEEHDAYNRLLAYVWRASDGLFINLDLVAGGYADILSIAPNTAHADEFRAAMNAAKTAPRGLWATCGGPGKPAS